MMEILTGFQKFEELLFYTAKGIQHQQAQLFKNCHVNALFTHSSLFFILQVIV